MAKELELSRKLSQTAIDRKDSELTSLSMALQQQIEENSILKSELRKIGGGGDKNAITTLQTELDKIRGELEEKEQAIATLKTELKQLEDNLGEAAKNEIFLTEELNRFKYGIVPGEEPCGEQLQLFPPEEQSPPEEPSGTTESEPETPATEPITETTVFEPEETEPDTTEMLQTEVQPKLLNPKQLAEWINKNCNPEKPITDQDVRDWYNPKKNREEKRREKEEKYGHKLDHKDKRGTLWFTVD